MYHRWTMLLTVMINWVRLPYTAPHEPPVGHVALNVLIYIALHAYREKVLRFLLGKSNFDCKYTFLIDFTPNRIKFSAKSKGEV